MGGISIWQLLIVAVIVVLLFGTKKLRNLGSDLGSAVKGFKKAVSEENDSTQKSESIEDNSTEKTQVEAKSDKEKDQV